MATTTEPALTREFLEALIPAARRYDKARERAGLAVLELRNGFTIAHFNEAGEHRNFTSAENAFLKDKLLPKVVERLGATFKANVLGEMFGYTETLRRRQGLAAHLSASIQAWLERGAVGWENLDTERPGRITPAELPTIDSARLPRTYTFVSQMPPPAYRQIFFREFPFPAPGGGGTLRPDELVVRYPISDAELERVNQGQSYEQILRELPEARRPTGLHVHSGDINRPITGDQVTTHFSKTMDGVLAAVAHLQKPPFGLSPAGEITVKVKDVYLGGQELRIRQSSPGLPGAPERQPEWRAAVGRSSGEGGPRTVTLEGRLTPAGDGWRLASTPDVRLRGIEGAVQSILSERSLAMLDRLEGLLNRVARMAR